MVDGVARAATRLQEQVVAAQRWALGRRTTRAPSASSVGLLEQGSPSSPSVVRTARRGDQVGAVEVRRRPRSRTGGGAAGPSSTAPAMPSPLAA